MPLAAARVFGRGCSALGPLLTVALSAVGRRCSVVGQMLTAVRARLSPDRVSWFGLGLCAAAIGLVAYHLLLAPVLASPASLPPRPTPMPVRIEVSGEVAHPGLYELPPSARLGDAIQTAGGLTAEADDSRLNQAAHLSDGQRLVIPRQPYAAASRPTAPPRPPSTRPPATSAATDSGQTVATTSDRSIPQATLPGPTHTPRATLEPGPTRTPRPTLEPWPTRPPPLAGEALATRPPRPTYEPWPTGTPRATYEPWPTRTPRPTYEPWPTRTPRPTSEPWPTRTPRPTATRWPIHTPWPTRTVWPTRTPTPNPLAAATPLAADVAAYTAALSAVVRELTSVARTPTVP